MKLNIYSIYDRKAGAYLPPFTFRSHAEAIRAIQQTAVSKESNLGKYPEDFTLRLLGEFDDDTGGIEAQFSPTTVAEVNDLVLSMRDRFEQECG